MIEKRLKVFTIALMAMTALFAVAPAVQAGVFGFAYGTGFQNIPPNRLEYVTQAAAYTQPGIVATTFLSKTPTNRPNTMVAYAGSYGDSLSSPRVQESFPRLTPKKELLPLTGPKLN